MGLRESLVTKLILFLIKKYLKPTFITLNYIASFLRSKNLIRACPN